MTDLVEAAQNVNSHVSPPRELISGEPFHMLSLFISISNSHPTRTVVPSINTPLCTTENQVLIIKIRQPHMVFLQPSC
jgi:hypothetical protein